MRKVKAIIERAGDGNYSVYMDADDLDYLVTGTGGTAEEAIQCFKNGYEDTKRYCAEEGREFEEVEFEYEYDTTVFKHKLKVWRPNSPKKNSYGYDIWEGDDTNILFNYPYFTAHFVKIDIALVSDGTSTPDIPDGISEQIADRQSVNGNFYDLQGRQVKSATKGVYIVNGKKVVR